MFVYGNYTTLRVKDEEEKLDSRPAYLTYNLKTKLRGRNLEDNEEVIAQHWNTFFNNAK